MLMVSHKRHNIRMFHHIKQDLNPVRSAVDHIAENIQCVLFSESDGIQQPAVTAVKTMDIRTDINHTSSRMLSLRTLQPYFRQSDKHHLITVFPLYGKNILRLMRSAAPEQQ